MNNIHKSSKIYIAGHKGMVGSAIWRALEKKGYSNLIGHSSKELDLRNQSKVQSFFNQQQPDVVINAAARVGGILANSTFPYDFIMENMLIQNNLIQSAVQHKVQNFIFLGSSCIYPKHAPQPLKEAYLLTDTLEPTNEWYAIAKISGVKACEAVKKQFGYRYLSLMPTNLYGPNDNFDLQTSHVLPAMIRKFHEAKEMGHSTVTLWGTGSPFREFLHVDDLASAVLYALEKETYETLYNVGTGSDITIKKLAELVQKTVGHLGEIQWDSSKPDGTPKKQLDISKIQSLGWSPSIELETGIDTVYQAYINSIKKLKI